MKSHLEIDQNKYRMNESVVIRTSLKKGKPRRPENRSLRHVKGWMRQ